MKEEIEHVINPFKREGFVISGNFPIEISNILDVEAKTLH